MHLGNPTGDCVKTGMHDPIAGELRTGTSADVLIGTARSGQRRQQPASGEDRLRIHVAGVQATAGATGAG
jgi:hypothetical protein